METTPRFAGRPTLATAAVIAGLPLPLPRFLLKERRRPQRSHRPSASLPATGVVMSVRNTFSPAFLWFHVAYLVSVGLLILPIFDLGASTNSYSSSLGSVTGDGDEDSHGGHGGKRGHQSTTSLPEMDELRRTIRSVSQVCADEKKKIRRRRAVDCFAIPSSRFCWFISVSTPPLFTQMRRMR